MAHAVGVLQRPAQGLHAAQASAHHSGQGLNAQRIHQASLCIYPVLHGDHRKVCTVNFSGVRVGLHRPGGAEAGAEIVHPDDKKMVGIDRLARANHGVPPTFGFWLALIHAGNMVRCIQGVANQHRVGPVRIQAAISLVAQVIGAKRCAALQRQGLFKMHGLRCGDQHGVCIENKKTRRR